MFAGCDPGFSADLVNYICYKVLPYQDNEFSAFQDCYDDFNGADLLQFDSDAEVLGLLTILKSGKNYLVGNLKYPLQWQITTPGL